MFVFMNIILKTSFSRICHYCKNKYNQIDFHKNEIHFIFWICLVLQNYKNIFLNVDTIRFRPYIRPFSISGRIPDIETIRIPDIRLIFNAGYPVICRLSNVCQISSRNRISSIKNLPDIRNPVKKVPCPSLDTTFIKAGQLKFK